MGIKYSFVDSELYGTDDINDIARCLTGAGVMPFLSTVIFPHLPPPRS